jgi:hypothetical protein
MRLLRSCIFQKTHKIHEASNLFEKILNETRFPTKLADDEEEEEEEVANMSKTTHTLPKHYNNNKNT